MSRCIPLVLIGLLAACGGPDLETRTFELSYLRAGEANALISPYVYTDREEAPGTFEVSASAVTVRETPDNLDRIERVLSEFDVPRPLTMLHFQVIRADGQAGSDPAIEDVERELRRLFRFQGYDLLAETRVGVTEDAAFSQIARGEDQVFHIQGRVLEVRGRGDTPTLTVEVVLFSGSDTRALETLVTIPTGHAIVLGTTETEADGALILVVRAEILDTSRAAPSAERTREDSGG